MESNTPETTASVETPKQPPVNTKPEKHAAEPVRIREERAVIYSYPTLVYIWPLIALGYLLWFADKFAWLSPKTEAWIYAIAVVVVVLTMGIDINRNMAVFWVVVVAAVWFCVLWLRGVKGIVFFDQVGAFFAHLEPKYSADLGILISIFLSVIYLVMIAMAHLNDKWVFTQNEIVHYAAFRGTTSLGRGAKGVTASYRDFFELGLLLSGDIEVRTAQGNRVMARMKNVPLLWLRMRKIDRILAAYAVTPSASDEDSGESSEEEVM